MPLDVKHKADQNGVGMIDERVLVFVRGGRLTSAALDTVVALAGDRARRATAERPVGALAVVSGQAGLSENQLLERQRLLLRDLRVAPHVFFAFCVEGEGAQAIAMRAVVRVLMLGSSSMRIFTERDAAARWLAERVGMAPAEITTALVALSS